MVLLENYSAPMEGIHHTEPNASVNVDGSDFGSGTLYISESCVLWLNAADQGIQLAYKQISLHAISRDLTSFPHEHLLLHYEGSLPGNSQPNGHVEQMGDENDEDEQVAPAGMQDYGDTLIEIRFVPQNKESLEPMFQAMSTCQTLHPDEDCQLSDEEEFEDADEDGEFYTGEEGVANLTEEGAAQLQRLNNLLGRGGQGDGADLASRASHIHISNAGHHEEQAPSSDADQFVDADDNDMGQ